MVFKEPPARDVPAQRGHDDAEPAHDPDAARRGHAAAPHRQAPRSRRHPPPPGLARPQLRRRLRRAQPRRLRAPAPRRGARHPDPVHAPRRGRGRVGVGRADPRPVGAAPASSRSATTAGTNGPAAAATLLAREGRTWQERTHERPDQPPPRPRRRDPPADRAQRRHPNGVPRPHARGGRVARTRARPARVRQPRARLRRRPRAPRRSSSPGARSPTSRSSPATTTCSRRTQPYGRATRRVLKDAVHPRAAASPQVAGGVPAMCDGVTQGRDGMELSPLQPRRDRDVAPRSRSRTTCSTARCCSACATRSCRAC